MKTIKKLWAQRPWAQRPWALKPWALKPWALKPWALRLLASLCVACLLAAALAGCKSSPDDATSASTAQGDGDATATATATATAATSTAGGNATGTAATRAGGGDGDGGAAAPDVGDIKIALITMDSTDQYWITLNEGAQKAAAEFGVTVHFLSPDTKDDAQQIECVNSAVAGGYGAIVVAANGPDAISSALREAVGAGLKIVYVDSPANVAAEATFLTDNAAAGRTAGEELKTALENIGLSSGMIGIVNANAATDLCVKREGGFREVFAHTEYDVIETQYGEGDAAKSQAIAESYIAQGVVGIFGVDEGSTVGTGNALKAAGGSGAIGVGFGQSDAILSLIEDGYLLCSMAQNPDVMGYEGVRAAVAALGGMSLGGYAADTGVSVLRRGAGGGAGAGAGADAGAGAAATTETSATEPAATETQTTEEAAATEMPTAKPATQNTTDWKIALITMDSIDQRWATLHEGAQRGAADFHVTVDFLSPDTKGDAQQAECVGKAVAGGYDAIVIAANGPDAITPALREAARAGLKIVYVDSPANVAAEATFLTENTAAGRTAGEELRRALEGAGKAAGKIGIVNVNAATDSFAKREAGFRSAFEGSGFELLETQYGGGDAAKSQAAAEGFIAQGVVGIFGASEGSAVGVGNAIKASRGSGVVGVGFDKSDAIQSLIQDGFLLCTIAQNPDVMGYEGVREAVMALNGTSLGGQVTDTGVSVLKKGS